jgi:hypothetical protein
MNQKQKTAESSKIPEFQNIFNKRSQDRFCAIQAIIFHKRVASKEKCVKKYKNMKARGVLLTLM